MNLLINASEAVGGQPGKVSIRTALTERADSRFSAQIQAVVPRGHYALLEVHDNGIGMKPDTLKRIFDPFFTTKFTGRGLGLAAVLGIVKGHRGDIEVVSQPGLGTTFRILLPRSERAGTPRREPGYAAKVRATGQTVLVVDDEEIVRNAATAALERQGFRVLAATNGAEALGILRVDSRVSLVILDLTMPVMTGEQAIPLIKEMHPGIPIVLSSGFGETEILRRFGSSGIAGVLQKPYSVDAIISKVTQALQKSVRISRRVCS
jgi:two-component system cell cycle sensor histidine kinase/response regulator CckA